MLTNHSDNTKIFKAFCDETRLCILELLKSGEKCACKLLEELEIGQSTLSHHMKVLCESGIVVSRKEGKWSYYSINKSGVDATKQLIDLYTNIDSYEKCKCNNKTI